MFESSGIDELVITFGRHGDCLLYPRLTGLAVGRSPRPWIDHYRRLRSDIATFRIIIPFVVQVGLYVSPVAYSSQVVRQQLGDTWFLLYSLNPMVAVIDGFRWAILAGMRVIHWPGHLVPSAFWSPPSHWNPLFPKD
jgi:hypothetical protein